MSDQTLVLKAPLKNVECWNFSGDFVGNFEIGETVTIQNVYDKNSRVILCAERNGRPVHKDGVLHPYEGYRFIVPNKDLIEAGADIPLEAFDLVGAIIKYEDGDMDDEETKEFFDHLQESGVGKQLQGHYSSRMQ